MSYCYCRLAGELRQENLRKRDLRSFFQVLGSGAGAAKPQSRLEVDFCRHGPLTEPAFAIAVNTYVTCYMEIVYVDFTKQIQSPTCQGTWPTQKVVLCLL